MNAILNETLSGIEVVKGSSNEEREIEKYGKNAENFRDAFVRQGEIQALYIPLLLIAVTITLGLAHGIFLNFQGLMTLGAIISYIGLLSNLRFPTFISIWSFALVRLAISGAERLLEVMNKESEIDENVEGRSEEIKGRIEFNNVTFTYPGSSSPVLHDITFDIQPGQTVAIVGTTGSGKTLTSFKASQILTVLPKIKKGQRQRRERRGRGPKVNPAPFFRFEPDVYRRGAIIKVRHVIPSRRCGGARSGSAGWPAPPRRPAFVAYS